VLQNSNNISNTTLLFLQWQSLHQLMLTAAAAATVAATLLCRCLAAMGRFKDLAPRLLERLLQAAVVSGPQAAIETYTGVVTSALDPSDFLRGCSCHCRAVIATAAFADIAV
jgi:hypothetical protein